MFEQVSSQWVTFTHPFQLKGMSELHPPGTYELRVEKIRLDVGWEAYRMRYTLLLRSNGATSAWELTNAELEEVLAADTAHGVNSGYS